MRLASITAILLACAPSSLLAASGPFLSLGNTDFVVLIAFIVFVAAIIYFKAPHFAGRLIDGRIDLIRTQINEAKSIQVDAQENLAEAEADRKKSLKQVELIKLRANEDAELALKEAEKRIRDMVDRRVRSAEMQIAAAEAAARDEIKNQAIDLSVEISAWVIANSMGPDERKATIEKAIGDVEANIH